MTTQTLPPTLSIEACRRRLETGAPLFVLDVRAPAEFARVHVTGARLMPLDRLDGAALAAEGWGAGGVIGVICHAGARSAKACERLGALGLEHVFSIEGGTAAWEKAGLPVERGASGVISLERQVRIGAGLLVLIGTVLAWTVHPAFLGLAAFIGAGLVFAGVTDFCGMALLLAKMPWNKGQRNSTSCAQRI